MVDRDEFKAVLAEALNEAGTVAWGVVDTANKLVCLPFAAHDAEPFTEKTAKEDAAYRDLFCPERAPFSAVRVRLFIEDDNAKA